ncbi:MAG: gamma-glutamyltransferase, partial [Novosphingobium sp.]
MNLPPFLLRSAPLLALATAACVPPPSATVAAPSPAASESSQPGVAVGSPGLVSAADPRAAEAGVKMLRLGGSATD